MPRAKVTVGAVRNPKKLAIILNDQQMQISHLRVMCDSMLRSKSRKSENAAKKKAKAENAKSS
jgi:hypothetical protein